MKSPSELRRDTFELALEIQCPHIAPSLSTVEILLAVYGRLGEHDKFILSKGHGCVAWYVILKDLGYNPPLKHHPDIDVANGVECTTGSLGHGLPMAVGMALAKRLKGELGTVYILMGDGECQEGTVWESAMLASRFHLDNLCVIVDRNNLQTLDTPDNISNMGDLVEKFDAFGWRSYDVDGHDVDDIDDYLGSATCGSPTVLVAHTTKGKGISYMENNSIFHARLPNDEEIEIARRELNA
jgi:transketolase